MTVNQQQFEGLQKHIDVLNTPITKEEAIETYGKTKYTHYLRAEAKKRLTSAYLIGIYLDGIEGKSLR